MGNVADVICPDLFGDVAEYLEIDFSRISGTAGDYDFGLVFLRQVSNLVIVEPARFCADAILHRVENLAR